MRALAGLVVLVGTAAADPSPVRIDAALDGDVARFTVRYLASGEQSHELPRRGLITAATVIESAVPHAFELTPADQARARLDALFAKAPSPARTRGVLVSRDPFQADQFSIDTAAPRGVTLAVDVEITAPTCFDRDARYVAVPETWMRRVSPAMRVRDAARVDEACGAQRDRGAWRWVRFPARALAARPAGAPRIGAYANRAVIGKASFVKVELNLAAKLSAVPPDLATVILVDASRSARPDQLAAQRATVAAYLRAAPNGRVQVIAYARHARALLPAWTTASRAAPQLARALQALQPANGSNVSVALREAGTWLAQTSGTRRILLLSDEHLSTREEHAVADALPPDTLVHVVALGGASFVRDDDAALAHLAARTRGLSVRGGESGIVEDRPIALDATLLARPVTFDRLRLRTPGWDALATTSSWEDPACEADQTLEEGTQCTWWGRSATVGAPVVVEGYLWGERVERVVRADLDRSLDVVRALSVMQVLDSELQALADRAARAVNSVWSLYATWGGDGGYRDSESGGGVAFAGYCGCDASDLVGHGFSSGTINHIDLAPALERIVRSCAITDTLVVGVETTLEEIVDVEITGGSTSLRTCVEDALWQAPLGAPGAPARTTTRLVVEP